MSAIAGILNFDGCPIKVEDLERMGDVSIAAGPDGRGIWSAVNVGLAHRLLITTPESRNERQPFQLGDYLWIVADARLDNRAELADLLQVSGQAFDAAEATDDEYIIRAYQAWGIDCLPRLLGDFAFIIWDAEQRQLVCARDCFGIRPLYYYVDSHCILLGSEIKQILSDPNVPRDLNDEVVEDWLILGHRKQVDATFYKAISQIPAGHYLKISSVPDIKLVRYWEWRQPKTIRYRSAEQYAEHLLTVFGEAVNARLRAVGPVGLFLSGGLDSSSIAGVAAKVLRQQGRDLTSLRGYSFVYDAIPSVDERAYIKPLVEFLGIKSIYLYPEKYDAFENGWPADEPDSSDAYDPTWRVAQIDLRQHGGRVMLTGYGGETLFLSQSDYHFIDWLFTGRWLVFIHELRAYRRTYGCWPRVGWRGLALRSLPQWLYRRLPVRSIHRQGPPWLLSSSTATQQRVRRWRRSRSPLNFSSFSKQVAFERLAGANSAATLWSALAQRGQGTGIEYAHPFMDRRLHEFVYAVPVEEFFHGAQDRAILRRAVAGLLPDQVRLRGPQTLFDEWFITHCDHNRLWQVAQNSATPSIWAGLRTDYLQSTPPDECLERYWNQLIWLALFMHWGKQPQDSGELNKQLLKGAKL